MSFFGAREKFASFQRVFILKIVSPLGLHFTNFSCESVRSPNLPLFKRLVNKDADGPNFAIAETNFETFLSWLPLALSHNFHRKIKSFSSIGASLPRRSTSGPFDLLRMETIADNIKPLPTCTYYKQKLCNPRQSDVVSLSISPFPNVHFHFAKQTHIL